MKRIVTSVCAGIVLVASFVAVSSWVELRKAREANVASRERQVEVPRPASLPVAPPPATVAAATPPDTPISRTESSAPSPAMKSPAGMLMSPEGVKERLKDPNMQKNLLAQIHLTIDQDYPDLAVELGLSKTEAEALFDLLADDRLARTMEGSVLGGPNVDLQEMRRKQQDFDRKREESIRAQLGDRYSQWQAYQQTLPARVQVAAMSTQLGLAEMPLTTTQSKALTKAVIAAHQRQAEEEKLIPPPPPGNPADSWYQARRAEASVKRAEEINRRTLEAAASYVDATQLAAMRRQLEGQTSAYRRSLRTYTQSQQAPAQ